MNNWWGTSSGPLPGDIDGGAAASSWLVLGIAASPSTITTGGTSIISANLTHNSTGINTAGSGTVPDGTPVIFSATGGTLSPHHAATESGIASTTLTPSGTGTAYITATVDGQSVTVPVTVTTPAARHERDEHRHRPGQHPRRSMPGVDGSGIYRSTTSGGSWTGATTQPANKNIRALVIRPAAPATLFAGTYGGGVYTSTDSGDHWTACTNTNLANLNVLSLVSNSTGGLYAGTENGVYTSTDCNTWTAINGGLP